MSDVKNTAVTRAMPRPTAQAAPYVKALGPDLATAFLLAFGGAELYLAKHPRGQRQPRCPLGLRKGQCPRRPSRPCQEAACPSGQPLACRNAALARPLHRRHRPPTPFVRHRRAPLVKRVESMTDSRNPDPITRAFAANARLGEARLGEALAWRGPAWRGPGKPDQQRRRHLRQPSNGGSRSI